MSSAPPDGHHPMTPTTSLDERFSDPGAQAVPWSDTQQVLADAQLFWVTTVRPDGRPHSTPLVAVWLDDALHFCTGPTEQKAHNLAANPNVLLTTGDNGWKGGLDVVVEGPAVRVTDEALLGRLAQAWQEKWDGEWQFVVHDGDFHHPGGGVAFVFRVEPTKVLAFGKGTFTHTRHRF
jgi:general stress protein 26